MVVCIWPAIASDIDGGDQMILQLREAAFEQYGGGSIGRSAQKHGAANSDTERIAAIADDEPDRDFAGERRGLE